MTLDHALWAFVVVLVLVAWWYTLPRPVELDWERLFKIALVTGIRGPIEAREGGTEEWLAAGRERVWYHPASRGLAEKLARPDQVSPIVPALPGERALLEKLAATESRAERLDALFASGADEPLYDDPAVMGEGWDLARMLGPDATWDAVSTWEDGVVTVLNRRLEKQTWVCLGQGVDLIEPLGQVLGERAVSLPVDDGLLEALEELCPTLADRLVLIVQGEAARAVIELVHADEGLRNRITAVVGLSLALDDAWMAEHFNHVEFDTEVHRAAPWFHLAFLERESESALGTLPVPEVPPTGRAVLDPIDLGALPGPASVYPGDLLARSLLIVVAARLALS